MNNDKKLCKQRIDCPICGKKNFVKQYISMHIKREHPGSEYSQLISKGMKFKPNPSKDIFLNIDKYYCKVCQKAINKTSLYMHLKSLLHKKLLQNNTNNINNEIINQNIQNNSNSEFKLNKSKIDNTIENEKETNIHMEKIKDTINNENKCSNILNINTNNIIKLKIRYDNNLPFNKKSNSIISASIVSKSYGENNENKDKVYYTQISNGKIPNNFINNSTNKCYESIDESKSWYIKEENELIYNNSYSYSNYSFSSISSEEEINNDSLNILSLDEMEIKNNVDRIIQKLIDKKRRKRKNKNDIK